MATTAWFAVLMIYFADGTFVEVRGEPFAHSPMMSSKARCDIAERGLVKRTDWLQVSWRWGKMIAVVTDCRQLGIDEIDI